jgi:hypothetical protein
LAKVNWPLKLVGRMMLLPLPIAPIWLANAMECSGCQQSFTTFFRAHTCRHCSLSVCANCSTRKLELRKYLTGERKRRVCDYCYQCLNLEEVKEDVI